MAGKLSETASDIAGFVKGIFGFGEEDPGKSRIEKLVESLKPLKGINANDMKGLNLVLDDLERLGALNVNKDLGKNIKNFAKGFVDAMPDLESALYGGTIGSNQGRRNKRTIRGLANGGQDFQVAVDSLNQLMMAAQGVQLQAAAAGTGGGTTINNIDNSTSGSTSVVASGAGSSRGHPSAGVSQAQGAQ